MTDAADTLVALAAALAAYPGLDDERAQGDLRAWLAAHDRDVKANHGQEQGMSYFDRVSRELQEFSAIIDDAFQTKDGKVIRPTRLEKGDQMRVRMSADDVGTVYVVTDVTSGGLSVEPAESVEDDLRVVEAERDRQLSVEAERIRRRNPR